MYDEGQPSEKGEGYNFPLEKSGSIHWDKKLPRKVFIRKKEGLGTDHRREITG